MNELQATDKAAVLANEFYYIVRGFPSRDVFLVARELAAALEGMALAHEQRIGSCCPHRYIHHFNSGAACGIPGCACLMFEEAM